MIRGTRSPFTAHAAFGAGLGAWSRTLWKHGGSVAPSYWPRVAAITFVVALNAPLRMWERVRFGSRIAKAKIQDPVFILGHPRSGTTYLHYVMSRDPQFAFPAVYQSLMPWTFLTMGRPWRQVLGKALPPTRPMDNVKMTADAPKEEEFALACMGPASLVIGYFFPKRLQRIFEDAVLLRDAASKDHWQRNLLLFMRKLTVKHGPKPLLLKSPANTARVKEILELFPNARFIHIHRDPLTVYASNLRLYEKILPQQALQAITKSEVETFILRSYRQMLDKYGRDKSLIPAGRLVEFSYEAFVGNELDVLEKAYAQLGLNGFAAVRPLMEREIVANEDYRTNTYTLSGDEQKRVLDAWG
ncbi:MAG: sulfotransferase [Flavobacteriales bacterium]